MDQNNHKSDPMIWSISDATIFSSASGERIHYPGGQPSAPGVLQNSDCKYSCPERIGGCQTKGLSKISLLNEDNTSNAEHFQVKSENFSELMTHKDEHSLEIESSWTLLQHTCREVSINSGNKQTRQSKLLYCVFSESVSSEESESAGISQSSPASKLCSKQHTEEELASKKVKPPESPINIRTEENSGLGYFYRRFCNLYKGTSSQLLQTGTKVISQTRQVGSLWDPSGLTSQVRTYIRRLPLMKHLPQYLPLTSHWASSESHSLPAEYQVGSSPSEEAEAIRPAGSMGPYRVPGLTAAEVPGSSPSSVVHLESEEAGRISAFKQTLVQFPDQMQKLQECPLKDFLKHLVCFLPGLLADMHEVRGIYWLSVANCTEPDPQPACLLLLPSTLYALVLSDTHLGSMDIFHALSLSGLREIQIGFGGQSIRFLGSAESLLLTVFSYNKNLCQQICRDLLCVLMPESDATACSSHPLLQQDLVQLSLDWKAEIPDLVLSNGIWLSSKFQNTMVDMIYFLHGNMEVNIPSLAEVQLLLYTTVRVEDDSGQNQCQSLVLLNTHIALVKEDRVFYPHVRSLNTPPPRTQFDVTRFRALSEFRCIVVPEKRTLPAVQLVFFHKLKLASDSRKSLSEHSQDTQDVPLFTSPFCLQGSRHVAPEVWDLTLNSQDEALWLISHLTRL